jgi:hypothetical protein
MDTPGAKPVEPGARSWTRTLLWFAAALVLVVALLGLFRWEESATFRCPYCATRWDVTATGFGWYGHSSFSHRTRTAGDVQPSATCRRLLGGACAHVWPVERLRTNRFLGSRDQDFGLPPLSPFLDACEGSERLRSLLEDRIAAGTLTIQTVRDLCRLPAAIPPADVVDPRKAALVAQGSDLLKEAGETVPAGWTAPAPPAGAKR